jgi:type III secretory pathway component EscU
MCDEKRKPIQVIDMSGDKPSRVISINLSSMTFYLCLLLLVVSVAGSVYAGITKLGEVQARNVLQPVVKKCVQEEVSKQLAQFHEETRLQLEQINTTLQSMHTETNRNTQMLQILLKDRLHGRAAP